MSSIGAFVADVIGTSARQLVQLDAAVRLGNDPEAVHDARVAIRRLRSDLDTFAPLVEPHASRCLRRELKWLGSVLGTLRDLQVMTSRLAGDIGERSRDQKVRAELLEPLLRARDAARGELAAAMSGRRYAALTLDLVRWAEQPPLADPHRGPVVDDGEILRLVGRQWKKARRLARRIEDDSGADDLHDLRKQVKRARYAAQAARTAGLGPEGFARSLAVLQDHLGELHDAVVQTEWLATGVEGRSAAASFVAGQLHEAARLRALDRRSTWRDLWAQVEDVRF